MLEERGCTVMPIQFGAIENREGAEGSRTGEETRSRTLEHRYDPRDLMSVVSP
jgi:hypothetical protein